VGRIGPVVGTKDLEMAPARLELFVLLLENLVQRNRIRHWVWDSGKGLRRIPRMSAKGNILRAPIQ